MALGQTWLAHMKELFTRTPNLVLTQKWRSEPMLEIPRTRQRCPVYKTEVNNCLIGHMASSNLWGTKVPYSRRKVVPKHEFNPILRAILPQRTCFKISPSEAIWVRMANFMAFKIAFHSQLNLNSLSVWRIWRQKFWDYFKLRKAKLAKIAKFSWRLIWTL